MVVGKRYASFAEFEKWCLHPARVDRPKQALSSSGLAQVDLVNTKQMSKATPRMLTLILLYEIMSLPGSFQKRRLYIHHVSRTGRCSMLDP